MITVFHAPRSRSLRVVWLAEEMGLDLQLETVAFGGPRPPAFLECNPAGTLPAMRDGDIVLTESVAILQYLVERYGPTPLMVAPDEPGRPDYLQFLLLGEAGLAAPLNGVIGTMFRAPENERDNFTTRFLVEGYLRRMKLIERQLETHAYLAADRFTVADISAGYAIGLGLQLLNLGPEMGPPVLDYYQRLIERPAFQRAAAR